MALEEALTWLRERTKTHKREFLPPFVLITLGILCFFALASDIGFAEEVTRHRNKVLFLSISGGIVYALAVINIILNEEIRQCERDNTQLRSSLETTRQESESFSNLVKNKEHEISQLQETILKLCEQIVESRICQVNRVEYYRERIHLSLSNNAGNEVVEGDEIRVIDTAVGEVMGVFEVTNVRGSVYKAKSTHYVSALWLGHIIHSKSETLPPDTVAILVPKDRMKDERT